MNRQQLLAESVLSTKPLLGRYLTGFTDVTHVRQTPDLPNHVAWTLGHLALTMHRVAEKLDGKPLPAKDFITGDGFQGSAEKGVFDAESVCFGSRPHDQHHHWPTIVRCREVFDGACDRLADAVRSATDEALDKPASWGQTTIPMWQLIVRMVFHNGTHTGQIADLRRALGMRNVLS